MFSLPIEAPGADACIQRERVADVRPPTLPKLGPFGGGTARPIATAIAPNDWVPELPVDCGPPSRREVLEPDDDFEIALDSHRRLERVADEMERMAGEMELMAGLMQVSASPPCLIKADALDPEPGPRRRSKDGPATSRASSPRSARRCSRLPPEGMEPVGADRPAFSPRDASPRPARAPAGAAVPQPMPRLPLSADRPASASPRSARASPRPAGASPSPAGASPRPASRSPRRPDEARAGGGSPRERPAGDRPASARRPAGPSGPCASPRVGLREPRGDDGVSQPGASPRCMGKGGHAGLGCGDASPRCALASAHSHEHLPSLSNAMKLISERRSNTLARLHGDSPIYHYAWFAEAFTCAAFAMAHMVLLAFWARHDGHGDAFISMMFVTAIASATYFAKACHMGDFVVNGVVVPLPRYIDWITTTPLMLFELCHIAHAPAGTTLMVILCDLMMLGTGIIEAMIPWEKYRGIKQIWFGISCWFFVLMVAVLHFDVAPKAAEQSQVAADLFQKLEVLTIVVWSLYPIVVGIGRANMGLVTKPIEDIALCFLDVVAKIGMEGLIVASCMSGCLGDAEGH